LRGRALAQAFGFWWYWPIISRLRRVELRHKSTKALSKARRQSVGKVALLEGELLVSTVALANARAAAPNDEGEKTEGDDAGVESEEEDEEEEQEDAVLSDAEDVAFEARTRFDVTLKHAKLELVASGGGPPLQLELVAGSQPGLSDDGKQLVVKGMLKSATGTDADGHRVRLTMTLPAPPAALQRTQTSLLGWMSTRRRASTASSGQSLQEWQVGEARHATSI
jgi:hypothetical protein